jgi:hypothetical protein
MSRTKGSRNITPHGPTGQCVPGAAFSAAKAHSKNGVTFLASVAWYEDGRAVTWAEVKRSVATAYD